MSDSSRPNPGLLRQAPVSDSQADSVRIDHSVFTRAQCDVAWKVFSECKLWPGFSEIYRSSVRWEGIPWNAGSRLHFDIMEPERARVQCVITLCTPPQCVAWINHVSGYTMQQCVLFEPYIGGGTKVTTWIELTNAGLPLAAAKVRFVLKSLLHTWFSNFTAECDHRARAADSRNNADSCAHPD